MTDDSAPSIFRVRSNLGDWVEQNEAIAHLRDFDLS